MTEQELNNVASSIQTLTQQALSLYYRSKATIDFVNKKGGLAGATQATIDAYNASVAIVTLIENGAPAQGDYLGTLTANVTSPQF